MITGKFRLAGTQEVSGPAQTRLSYEIRSRALSSWILKIPADGKYTVSWATCLATWPCHKEEVCFYSYPVWLSFVSVYAHYLLYSCHVPQSPDRAWFDLLYNLIKGTGHLLWHRPKTSSSPGWTSPIITDSPSLDYLDGPPLKLFQFIIAVLVLWAPKVGTVL